MNEQMIRKNNMKIYPLYQMLSWDLLFYYAIVFLFLTQVKDFTASEVLIADSFYGIFRILFQIICINIVDLLGKQKSLLLGNILVTISIILMIIGQNFLFLIFAFLIQAIGYNFKGICEPTILSDSIPKSSFSSNIYSKIYGKGTSFYYIFDAISSIATGFLYVVNPYIPMIMCFICCLASTIISLAFENPINLENNTQNTKSPGFIDHYKDMLITFKQIMKSNRLKSLLIFSLCFWAFYSVFGTLRSSILVDLYVPEQYFGIIVAGCQILSSISSQKYNWFHKKFKNRALSWISLSLVSSFIITGLIVICNIKYILSIVTVLLTIILFGITIGPYFTLLQTYFNSFSNSNVNAKIFAVKSLLENIGRVIMGLFTSFLLSITTTSYALVIIGCMFFIIFVFLLESMKTKLGLNPEEYSEEDLVFSDNKN